ncbi:hypothetical protein RRG08_000102 [Elysia crispata]|uniref:Uncharacterized protein n=1 Tax=Elysia crispata TaxID=231223 RepID=A0AAE0Z3M6_9GAST|nr:hypothetical protein RRG08_000102 [Elysia crispata]
MYRGARASSPSKTKREIRCIGKQEHPALHIWSERLDVSSQVTVIALVRGLAPTFGHSISREIRVSSPSHLEREFRSIEPSNRYCPCLRDHLPRMHSVSQKTRVSSPSHLEREFRSIEPSNRYCPCPRDHLPRMHSVSQKTRVSSPSPLEREFRSIEPSNRYCPCPRDHLPRMHSVSQKTRVSSPSPLEREFRSIEPRIGATQTDPARDFSTLYDINIYFQYSAKQPLNSRLLRRTDALAVSASCKTS